MGGFGMPGLSDFGGGCGNLLIPPPLNREGHLGPTCKMCDGWGYMLRIKGGGACPECKGTGIKADAFQDPAVAEYVRRMQHELRLLERRANRIDPGLSAALKLQELLDIKNSRQFWSEQIWWATASGGTVSNTTTETILFPNITIPANYMQDGRTLQIRAQGQHSTAGSGTVTLTFRLRWGGVSGTTFSITGAITQVISLTAAYWDLDILLQTRTNGSSGAIMANGIARVFGATAPTVGSATGAPAISPITNGGQITPAATTLDLTADTALSLTIQQGANTSGNNVIGLNYIGVSMN